MVLNSKTVRIRTNTNDIFHMRFDANLSEEQIIKQYESKGGNRENLMFENKPDVNLILSLGYKGYKLIKGKFIPHNYNTLYHATNYNVMQDGGLAVFFFKTENFENEEPIVIGLAEVYKGVSYIRLPKELEYLRYKIYKND